VVLGRDIGRRATRVHKVDETFPCGLVKTRCGRKLWPYRMVTRGKPPCGSCRLALAREMMRDAEAMGVPFDPIEALSLIERVTL